MKLIYAPVGLFMYEETLCLKTEYMNSRGGVEAYIVESGEVFWGGAKSQEERNNLDVHPVSIDDLRPHGRWIMRGGKRYCSHCGERACVTRDMEDFWYTVRTKFCPECGAIMDKED